jgi:tetratricopeptide (TPR) repeat protein
MIRSIVTPLLFAGLAATIAVMNAATARGEDYKTYREAHAAGAKAVKAGNLAAAREPFEAAAKLATTDREKLDAYRSLLVPYRELQEVAPMQTAAEFIITHSKQSAERSLTRSAMLSFVHKRGKTDDVVAGYETRLEKDPADQTALYLLTELYATFKKDPVRAVDRGAKYLEAVKKAGLLPDLTEQAKLAELYVRADRPKEGAALFEVIAAGDAKMEAWHWKEAAVAWLKAGDKAKAVASARKSAAATPEARSDLLTYFWRRGLGDVFLDAGEPKDAIAQYEGALGATKNEGYVKATKEKLALARKAAGL